jgi:amidase
MPDFGMRWHTDNALHGPTRNPWDLTRTPYGSSGGEAVAVATGASPLGIGNDYGGSIRLPAAAAGIVGLRPTHGRIPSATSTNPMPLPLSLQLFAVEGPLARRVADVAAAYTALCRPDPRDPQWVPVPPDLPLPGQITVAVVTDPGGLGVHPDIAAAVRRAADTLADAGITIVEHEPPDVLAAAELWRALSTADVRGLVDGVMRTHASPGGFAYLQQSITHARRLDLDGYLEALAHRHAIAAAWSQFTAHTHAVLGPVSTQPVPQVPFDLALPAPGRHPGGRRPGSYPDRSTANSCSWRAGLTTVRLQALRRARTRVASPVARNSPPSSAQPAQPCSTAVTVTRIGPSIEPIAPPVVLTPW